MIILTCDNCGKKFERSNHHFRKNKKRGDKHFFCSRKCHYDFSKLIVCTFCGSSKIYNHGKSYRITACEKCFKVWLKERRKRIWKCVLCGSKHVSYSGEKNNSYICKGCRNREKTRQLIKICDVCNSIFLSKRGQEFCTRTCTLIANDRCPFWDKKQYLMRLLHIAISPLFSQTS